MTYVIINDVLFHEWHMRFHHGRSSVRVTKMSMSVPGVASESTAIIIVITPAQVASVLVLTEGSAEEAGEQ